MEFTCRINASVVNLRNKPIHHQLSYDKDPIQESQLLYSEIVRILSVEKDWAFVEAVEQHSYRGWIPIDTVIHTPLQSENTIYVSSTWAEIRSKKSTFKVSFGTALEKIDASGDNIEVLLPDGNYGTLLKSDVESHDIVINANKFIGSPYLWGGRSAYYQSLCDQQVTGVDCSGLISLLHRVKGKNIPRNAVDQWKVCKKIEKIDLEIGDLVFTSTKGGAENIDHVMLYIGEGKLIESTMSVGCVREISISEKRALFPQDDFFYGSLEV